MFPAIRQRSPAISASCTPPVTAPTPFTWLICSLRLSTLKPSCICPADHDGVRTFAEVVIKLGSACPLQPPRPASAPDTLAAKLPCCGLHSHSPRELFSHA